MSINSCYGVAVANGPKGSESYGLGASPCKHKVQESWGKLSYRHLNFEGFKGVVAVLMELVPTPDTVLNRSKCARSSASLGYRLAAVGINNTSVG